MFRSTRALSVRFAVTLAIVAVAFLASMTSIGNPEPALAAGPGTAVVYNNIPSPQPGNLPSLGYEATSTSEFGGLVSLAGTARANPSITVLMSSWGCQTGRWNLGTCATTPGATFSHSVLLKLYSVGPGNTPGTFLTALGQNFSIPFRPSADPVHCTAGNAGKWWDGVKCNNGYATPITFTFLGPVTLPNQVIVSVAFNTTHYGAAPIGTGASCYSTSAGCGYDALNVALFYPPSVGSVPSPLDAYLNSSSSGSYCAPSPTGTFRLDPGCWYDQQTNVPYQPAIKIEASTPIQVLRDSVNNSGSAYASRLDTYLRSAQTYLALNTPTMKAAACQQLLQFKVAVTVAMRIDPVAAAQGAGWITQANAIRASIPCVAPN